MQRFLICLVLLSFTSEGFEALAQKPFQHDAAIPYDTLVISGWATHCSIERGFQNIADAALGYASYGDESAATGPARETGVVSLGDGGTATLLFAGNIYNGDGPDFAVFENGFSFNNDSTFYLELAYVEVSSDGSRFVRFPATTFNDTLTQYDFTNGSKPGYYHNLAGNYAFGYGTPFDLEQLKDSAGVDINRISHIRMVDVVGSMLDSFARRDCNGIKINDPWTTPFASGGFDLDAVGVIHLSTGIEKHTINPSRIYPNPVQKNGTLHFRLEKEQHLFMRVLDINGHTLRTFDISTTQPEAVLNGLDTGMYFVELSGPNTSDTLKLCITE